MTLFFFAEKYNEQFVTQTIEIKQPSLPFRELILKYGGAKKEADKKKEKQHRSRKTTTTTTSVPEEPIRKKDRSCSNPPLSKLKIPRSLVENEKRRSKNKKSASSDNLVNLVQKSAPMQTNKVSPPVTEQKTTVLPETKQSASSDNLVNLVQKSAPMHTSKVSPQAIEQKTAVLPEAKQVEIANFEPSTSADSNYSDSDISKTTTMSMDTGNSTTPSAENDAVVEKHYDFEFLIRLQKKLITLDDPSKLCAIGDALLTPASSGVGLPPDVLFSDNNILSFDICKLNSVVIGKLSEICFGNA
ncbi:unnamed protein product [Gongylonema pulchrum]|uniref:AHD domain-containing protein n=1 Tax=Gongylonema pulchrum TaxID=637853 RepID=A0A183E908_9BILA|nr:unnamed protein product [Gongylonema pulchrum]